MTEKSVTKKSERQRDVILNCMSRSRKRTTHAVEGSLPGSRRPTTAGSSPENPVRSKPGTNPQSFPIACLGLIAEALRTAMYPDTIATSTAANEVSKVLLVRD